MSILTCFACTQIALWWNTREFGTPGENASPALVWRPRPFAVLPIDHWRITTGSQSLSFCTGTPMGGPSTAATPAPVTW